MYKYKNKEINILGEDIILKVDETLISMAISNLIENALKYSDDEVIVEISSNSICIIDKGIGIEAKELEKFFVSTEDDDTMYKITCENISSFIDVLDNTVKRIENIQDSNLRVLLIQVNELL